MQERVYLQTSTWTSPHPAWTLVPIFRFQRFVEYGVSEVCRCRLYSTSLDLGSLAVGCPPFLRADWYFGSRFSLAILSSKSLRGKSDVQLEGQERELFGFSFEFYCLANHHRPFRNAECVET